MITLKKGNIFTTNCQTIVNTINCVGVMGAGIAFEFKLRNPDMFNKYKNHCMDNQINIGKLWIYKVLTPSMTTSYQNILNFPTKHHWKFPSKEEYLEKGLQKFLETYQQKGITSIAFPMLGADKGGLTQEKSLSIMTHYLEQCDIPVEIWHFDPSAKDDLYDQFKTIMSVLSDEEIKAESKLRIDAIQKLKQGLMKKNINSLSGLLREKGIGEKTIEKSLTLIKNANRITPKKETPVQVKLF